MRLFDCVFMRKMWTIWHIPCIISFKLIQHARWNHVVHSIEDIRRALEVFITGVTEPRVHCC